MILCTAVQEGANLLGEEEAVVPEALFIVGLQSLDEDCFWIWLSSCQIKGPFESIFKVNNVHIHYALDGHVVCFQVAFSCESFIEQTFESFVEVARSAQGACGCVSMTPRGLVMGFHLQASQLPF